MGLYGKSKRVYKEGLAYKLERAKHNKSEDWEVPMNKRKNRFDDGGGVDRRYGISFLKDDEVVSEFDEKDLVTQETMDYVADEVERGFTNGNLGGDNYGGYFKVHIKNRKKDYSVGDSVIILYGENREKKGIITKIDSENSIFDINYTIDFSGNEISGFRPNHVAHYDEINEEVAKSIREGNVSSSDFTFSANVWSTKVEKNEYGVSGIVWYVTNESAGDDYDQIAHNVLTKDEFDDFLSDGKIERTHFDVKAKYDWQIRDKIYAEMAENDQERELDYEEGRHIIGYKLLLDNQDSGFGSDLPYEVDEDSDLEFRNGGGVNSGRDRMFKSKQPHEQNYKRKTEWKEYKKEGWFGDWFANGGGVNDYGMSTIQRKGYTDVLVTGADNLKKLSKEIDLTFELDGKFFYIKDVDGNGIITKTGRVNWESISDRKFPDEDGLQIGYNDWNNYFYFKLTDEERTEHPYNNWMHSKADMEDAWRDKEDAMMANGGELPYYVYNYETNTIEKEFDNEIEAEEFATQFKNADVYRNDKYAKGGGVGKDEKSKIKIIIDEDGRKIASRTLVTTNKKGEKINYELSVGRHSDTKDSGWFEIYVSDEDGEEIYYAEGGLWFEGGRVTDYDGVYELNVKLRPLMSALNLNSSDVFENGGNVEYAKGGGVNTGRSWHLDRQKSNKSESWEKPMSKRKQRYNDGGGIGKDYEQVKLRRSSGYFVVSGKENKILSKGFDNENEAKNEMYNIFEKNKDFSLAIKKLADGGNILPEGEVFHENPLFIKRLSNGFLDFDFDFDRSTGWSFSTDDVGVAVAVITGSHFKNNPEIRNIEITPKQLRLSDKKRIVYWLSGGNKAWVHNETYLHDFDKTYDDLWVKDALKLKKSIQKFKTIGELLDFYKKEYLDYPYFYGDATDNGYVYDSEREEEEEADRIRLEEEEERNKNDDYINQYASENYTSKQESEVISDLVGYFEQNDIEYDYDRVEEVVYDYYNNVNSKSLKLFRKGGGINSGRDLLFKSKQPHEQNYKRKTEWKEYNKEGWFGKWFANGGGVGELEIGNEVEIELNNGKIVKGKIEKINPLKIRTDVTSTQVIPNALIKNITKYAKGGGVGYGDIKKEKQKMTDDLLKKCGVFFAFSNEQFLENKTPLKEGEKYVSIGGGGYMPKGNLDAFREGMKSINQFGKNKVKENNLAETEILYELNNHECFYTGDYSDVVDMFKGTYTEKQIRDVYNKHKESNQDFKNGGGVEDTIAERYARLTETEANRLDELSKKVRINEQTESEDIEWDKLVHKYRGWDYKYANGGNVKSHLLSIEEVESKIGRKLNSWHDDVVSIGSLNYKKVYLKPFYKIIN